DRRPRCLRQELHGGARRSAPRLGTPRLRCALSSRDVGGAGQSQGAVVSTTNRGVGGRVARTPRAGRRRVSAGGRGGGCGGGDPNRAGHTAGLGGRRDPRSPSLGERAAARGGAGTPRGRGRGWPGHRDGRVPGRSGEGIPDGVTGGAGPTPPGPARWTDRCRRIAEGGPDPRRSGSRGLHPPGGSDETRRRRPPPRYHADGLGGAGAAGAGAGASTAPRLGLASCVLGLRGGSSPWPPSKPTTEPVY